MSRCRRGTCRGGSNGGARRGEVAAAPRGAGPGQPEGESLFTPGTLAITALDSRPASLGTGESDARRGQ
jgi:hypothetical protein